MKIYLEMLCWSWFLRPMGSLGYRMHNEHKFLSISLWRTGDLFQSERDIRQEDLVLYLNFYCLCWILGRYINSTTNTPKTDRGIKIAKYSSVIPYLMFANDCSNFCKENRKEAWNVKMMLDNYCKFLAKSSIFIKLPSILKRDRNSEKPAILDICKYLHRISLVHLRCINIRHRRFRSDFAKFQDLICSKLEGCRAPTLSQTGTMVH